MAGLKAIRRRITSVRNTMQITRAMKLVSAAKLRRAQDAAVNGRHFCSALEAVFCRLVLDLPCGFRHPLLQKHSRIKRRRIVVFGGERGLCGAYNTNIIKAVEAETRADSAETECVLIGRRAAAAGRRLGWHAVETYEGLPDDAKSWPIAAIAEREMHDYASRKCDEVVLYYTKFHSAMRQEVVRQVLLPLPMELEKQLREPGHDEEISGERTLVPGLMRHDPSAEKILAEVLPLLVRTRLRHAGLEARASEHAARMTAMDAATSNADELIQKLTLHYNRARQSTITRELIDIVGGAEALK